MSFSPIVRRFAALALVVTASGCGSSSPVAPDQSSVAYSQTDFTIGTGAEATAGKTATVQYAGWLYSETGVDKKGAQFEANVHTFVLGGNQVIKGFDTGVTGMRVGGTRRVIIPPSLAYGASGNGPIPPNTAVVFDLALTNVQ